MSAQSQDRFRELLGVRPDATLEEINTAYFLLLEKLSVNPSDKEGEQQLELQHAYTILRRAHETAEPKLAASRWNPRVFVAVAGILLVVLIPVLVIMNLDWFTMATTEYETGDVLRLSNREAPFGTVVGFHPAHRFHTGQPGPAYQVRLAETGETVWISERVVVKGMVKISDGGSGAPGERAPTDR